jgi:hypothetical protein
VLHDTDEVLLVDVGSGQVRARCAVTAAAGGLASVPLRVDGRSYGSSAISVASVVVPEIAPDLRSVIDIGGVLDLVDFRSAKVGDSGWAAAALPGEGRVLLARRPPQGGSPAAGVYERASGWCLLPARDVPVERCAPISDSTQPGTPAVHGDGTVSWAPSAGVPLRFGQLSGWAQTDGIRLTRAEVLPPAKKTQGSSGLMDVSGTAGWIDPSDLATALGERVSDPGSKRIAWFTTKSITTGSVTAELHRSPVTTAQLAREVGSAFGDDPGAIYGVRIAEDGNSITVAVRQSSDAVVIARVGSDGSVRKLASLPGLQEPKIIAWPAA